MAAKQNSSILGEAKPSKAIVKLALPATLALLAKAVYNIVDPFVFVNIKIAVDTPAYGLNTPEGIDITASKY